jgi:hypothetical protein
VWFIAEVGVVLNRNSIHAVSRGCDLPLPGRTLSRSESAKRGLVVTKRRGYVWRDFCIVSGTGWGSWGSWSLGQALRMTYDMTEGQ